VSQLKRIDPCQGCFVSHADSLASTCRRSGIFSFRRAKELLFYYGGSVAADAFVGGVGGAFFGGVGAVPGAAAGAVAGSYVGGDLAALVGRANVGANGMTADRVAALLRSEGVDASFKSRMTIQDLADATANGNPAIAAVRQGGVGHAIVIDEVTTRQGVPVVAIRDPWGQQYFEKIDVFNQRFLKQGIVINGKPK
jgi:hypothetical protein